VLNGDSLLDGLVCTVRYYVSLGGWSWIVGLWFGLALQQLLRIGYLRRPGAGAQAMCRRYPWYMELQ
jgi:hypothetical protein